MSDSDFTMDDFRAEMQKRGVIKRTPYASKANRARRATKQRWQKGEGASLFFSRLRESCLDRLLELENRSPDEIMPCPWAACFAPDSARIIATEPRPGVLRVAVRPDCLPGCKCGESGQVTVGFMVEHYRSVLAEYGDKP